MEIDKKNIEEILDEYTNEENDVVIPISSVESQYDQFNKYGEVLFRDEIAVSRVAFNNAFLRKVAEMSISFTIMKKKRNLKKMNYKLEKEAQTLTGKLVDLEALKAHRRNIEHRNYLKNEIEAHKKLRDLLKASKKAGKSR